MSQAGDRKVCGGWGAIYIDCALELICLILGTRVEAWCILMRSKGLSGRKMEGVGGEGL